MGNAHTTGPAAQAVGNLRPTETAVPAAPVRPSAVPVHMPPSIPPGSTFEEAMKMLDDEMTALRALNRAFLEKLEQEIAAEKEQEAARASAAASTLVRRKARAAND